MNTDSLKYQYFATFCVNILSIAYGSVCGWPSASFLILQSPETPLKSGPLSNEEISWVGSLVCLGGLIGNILFGWLSNRFGRKLSLLVVAFPLIISWFIIVFATNVYHLCISRFLGGICGGGVFVLVPLYITEISEDRVRGSLGSCLVLCTNVGTLLAFVLGNFCSYFIVLYILTIVPIVFLFGFIFLPETPQHLLKMKKEKEAENALRYFRNLRRISQEPPESFKMEMQKLKFDFLDDDKVKDETPLRWSDFTNRAAIKALIIGAALCALNQLCGCFAMLNYTATIFKQSGSNLTPNMSAIVVGVIQLIGAYISTILVDRAGRKILMTVSATGTGLGLVSLGLFTHSSALGYDLENFNWIPVASFSFVLFIASWGVLTLPFLIMSEILPPKIRDAGCTFCMGLLWIFAFAMVKSLPLLTASLGMPTCMYIFATCSFAGAIFILLMVPETKGKSIESILAMMEK